jgi:hypothetical protein
MKSYFIRYRCNNAVNFSKIIKADTCEEALALYRKQDWTASQGTLMEIYVIE